MKGDTVLETRSRLFLQCLHHRRLHSSVLSNVNTLRKVRLEARRDVVKRCQGRGSPAG